MIQAIFFEACWPGDESDLRGLLRSYILVTRIHRKTIGILQPM